MHITRPSPAPPAPETAPILVGRHANVLQHMLGYLRPALDRDQRAEIDELIGDYRRELVPLLAPLTLLRHHLRKLRIEYLLGQVYLEPNPRELMLRNHA